MRDPFFAAGIMWQLPMQLAAAILMAFTPLGWAVDTRSLPNKDRRK